MPQPYLNGVRCVGDGFKKLLRQDVTFPSVVAPKEHDGVNRHVYAPVIVPRPAAAGDTRLANCQPGSQLFLTLEARKQAQGRFGSARGTMHKAVMFAGESMEAT